LALTQGKNFWVIAVYTPMPSSGDASTDLKSGWKRIVLAGPDYQGFPLLPYYDVAHTVGYPGKRADASSINRTGYTRLYVLEAIRTNLTVADISGDWQSGVANSISFYSSSTGAYQSNSNSFVGAAYHIAANGAFTYKMSGVKPRNICEREVPRSRCAEQSGREPYRCHASGNRNHPELHSCRNTEKQRHQRDQSMDTP
jgi:hypothetical protein